MNKAMLDAKRFGPTSLYKSGGSSTPLGFNQSMQHTKNCESRRGVADEAKTTNLLR